MEVWGKIPEIKDETSAKETDDYDRAVATQTLEVLKAILAQLQRNEPRAVKRGNGFFPPTYLT